MRIHFAFLWTDLLVYLLFLTIIGVLLFTRSSEHWRDAWERVGRRKLGMIAFVLLIAYGLVAFLDSIHFKISPVQKNAQEEIRAHKMMSFLDWLLLPLGEQDERTYSAPFSLYSSARTTVVMNGESQSIYLRLEHGGRALSSPSQRARHIIQLTLRAFFHGFVIALFLLFGFLFLYSKTKACSLRSATRNVLTNKGGRFAWREVLLTSLLVIIVICFIKEVSPYYHILGTNKIGNDVLYETIKSIRTGLIIGTLTTLVILPFALWLGTQAGYFGGWRDDVIQYIYTTLSSIPGVLLISAAVLSLQIFISNHSHLFPTLESRADARLLALCVILGLTSWTGLCRLLRAETLKLREMDYVKAAITMGLFNFKIIWRHIIPNIMHIVLISVVLDFSALVLAEAVLSYVGVGVDPTTPSWGNMINSARLDLAREPVVWWPLLAAFLFMFVLVLSANLFADSVREAFDPRLRSDS